MWQAYAPDGDCSSSAAADDEQWWVATCPANRVESESVEEAIRDAIGVPIAGTQVELDAWIADHAADLIAIASS